MFYPFVLNYLGSESEQLSHIVKAMYQDYTIDFVIPVAMITHQPPAQTPVVFTQTQQLLVFKPMVFILA